MTEITEGPWVPRFDGAITVRAKDGSRICTLSLLMGPREIAIRRPPNEVEANARFIAAAPETKRQRDELLAMLVWLLNGLDDARVEGDLPFSLIGARQMIAKCQSNAS